MVFIHKICNTKDYDRVPNTLPNQLTNKYVQSRCTNIYKR